MKQSSKCIQIPRPIISLRCAPARSHFARLPRFLAVARSVTYQMRWRAYQIIQLQTPAKEAHRGAGE